MEWNKSLLYRFARIDKLIRIRDEGQRVMLIRALGTSFQYALTQKFPGLFTSKYSYSCTFTDIAKKVATQNNALFNSTLSDVKKLFVENGIEEADISSLIASIRQLGVSTSHMTFMIGANGVEYKPTVGGITKNRYTPSII